MPPLRGYPELMKTMPPATTGPAPSIEPPLAVTPFTVEYVCAAVSKSQSISPSSVLNARTCPSSEGENTTPGISVSAADWPGLQPGRGGSHGWLGAYHAFEPSSRCSAVRPPPLAGSNVAPPTGPAVFITPETSETAAYTFCPSLAMPHCTPPFRPPFPTRVCHNIFPFASGSNPYTTPDFCPATIISFPFGAWTRIGEEPKSKSGPFGGGQFTPFVRHAEV